MICLDKLSHINYIAVLVSAIVAMGIGGLWYSPLLFTKAWMKENGFTEDSMKGKNPAKTMVFAFLVTIVMAFALSIILLHYCGFVKGLLVGGCIGIGIVATSLGILYLFEGKSLKLFLINAGYNVVTFIVMGGILGAWK